MESAVIGSDDPEPDPVTLTVILPLMIPVNPGALAVIGMLVQGATRPGDFIRDVPGGRGMAPLGVGPNRRQLRGEAWPSKVHRSRSHCD